MVPLRKATILMFLSTLATYMNGGYIANEAVTTIFPEVA